MDYLAFWHVCFADFDYWLNFDMTLFWLSSEMTYFEINQTWEAMLIFFVQFPRSLVYRDQMPKFSTATNHYYSVKYKQTQPKTQSFCAMNYKEENYATTKQPRTLL